MSMTERLAPGIKLDKEWLPAEWADSLIEVRIERELQVPARCSLRFVDVGYKLVSSGTVKLGASLVVSLPGSGGDALADVEITGISVEQDKGDHPVLNVVGHDKAHRLGHFSSVTTYANMSYGEIVETVMGRHKLQSEVSAPGGKLEYMLQVDSDLDLIGELARRTGCDWWMEGDVLHFKTPDTTSSPVVTLNLAEGNLLSFSVRATGHHPDTVKVDGWDRKAQAAVTASATTASSTLRPSSKLADLVKGPGLSPGPSSTLVSAGVVASSMDEARQLSQSIRDRMVAASVTARGTFAGGSALLKPGTSVDVQEAGPLTGKYHVTKVEMLFRAGTGMQTRFVAGDRTPTSLVDTLGGGNGSTSGGFRHPGLVVGQVTNIKDPQNLGRVKTRYPGVSETEESAWARVVSLGGGKSRGAVFIPEVGDEVLVGFESGDLRQPVVLGGLFGDKATMPSVDASTGTVPARRITSRLGHAVELADGKGPSEQHILLALEGEKHKFRLGKDKVDLEVPSGTPVTVKAGNSKIAFGQDGSIDIEGMNITLKATSKLSLEGVQVAVKASGQLSLEGTTQAALKGAMTQIDGSATLALKGGIVQIN